MDVRKWLIFIICSFFINSLLTAGELSRCLFNASAEEHRLEKENSVRNCFNKYKTFINKQTCYLFLAQRVSKLSSTKLSEDINSICFYETSPAKNLNSCLTEAKKFKISANHDEAVFYCYQQHQDGLSQQGCLKAANQLIYPFKKDYLQQHCLNYAN